MKRLVLACWLLPLAVCGASIQIDDEAFSARFGAPERYPTDVRMPFVVASSWLVVIFFLRRLRKAERRAEEAMLVKSRVLANLSHELQTPMNAILGLSHLLLETRLDVEQRQSIEEIRQSAGALQHTIRDLLDLSSTRHGLAVNNVAPADLLSLTEEVTAMILPAAREKGLELALCYHADVPRIANCDAGKIRQILIHLVANGVKFTTRGSVGIEVSRQQDRLRVTVRDTGPGIPAEQQTQVFEEFVSGDNSGTRIHRGLGLGLALCKQWISILGGEIGVDSNEGEGSTFWFNVPVAFEQDPAALPMTGFRALIVEDGSLTAQGLRQTLARLGIAVGEAPSAALAIRSLRQATVEGDPCHFVFLNAGRGPLDAETLRRSLASDPRSARVQVLPLAFVRFEDLRGLLSGQREMPVTRESSMSESLAALIAATSSHAGARPATTSQPTATA